MAITAVHMSTYGGADQFYNNGKYEDLSYGYVDGWESFETSPRQQNMFANYTTIRTFYVNVFKWQYLGLANASDTTIHGIIRTYYNGKIVSSSLATINPGENQISLTGRKIDRISMRILQEKKQSIKMRRVYVADYIEEFDIKRFGGEAAIIGVVIFGILLLLDRLLKIRTHIQQLLNWLGQAYVRMLTRIAGYLPEIRLTEKMTHGVRTGIFVILLTWNFLNSNNKKKVELYQISSVLYILACVVIYMISKPHCRIKKYWVTSYMGLWVLLCACMCISDFLVPKTYCYMGYIFLLIYGVLFTLYQDRQMGKDIIRDMAYAIQIFGVSLIVVSIVTKNIYGMGIQRISLGFTNANAWANYLVLLVVTSIVMMENTEKIQKWLPRTVFCVVECISAFYLIYLAQSRWALVIAVLFFSVWLFRMVKKRSDRKGTKRRLVVLLLLLCLSIPVGVSLNYIVMHNAGETEALQGVALEQAEQVNPFLMNVQASESRMMQKLQSADLNTFTSGRIEIWNSYIREMNLWGHKYLCSISGNKISSHNMFLAYFYRYGLFTGVVFVCFWIMCVYQSVRCLIMEKCSWYGLLQFGLIAGYCFLAQMDAFEHPWLYAGWTCAYMGIGLFGFQQNDIYELEKEE